MKTGNVEGCSDQLSQQADVDKKLYTGILLSLFWLAGIGSLLSLTQAAKARKIILRSNGGVSGMWKVRFCFFAGGLGLSVALLYVLLVLAAFAASTRGNSHSFTPSPNGRDMAYIREVAMRLPAPDNSPVLWHKVRLIMQEMPLSKGRERKEILINSEADESYCYGGGAGLEPKWPVPGLRHGQCGSREQAGIPPMGCRSQASA